MQEQVQKQVQELLFHSENSLDTRTGAIAEYPPPPRKANPRGARGLRQKNLHNYMNASLTFFKIYIVERTN